MDLHRSARMFFTIPLFIVLIGSITTQPCPPQILNPTDLHLDCSIDWDERMDCTFDAQNCSEYSLRLKEEYGESPKLRDPTRCSPQSAKCCCSFDINATIGTSPTVSVLRGDQREDCKVIDIKGHIKPKTPTILSVRDSNGNFEVKWDSHMRGFVVNSMTAEVTLRKKDGGEEKTYPDKRPTTVGDENIYEIPAGDVESSSTYEVHVRSLYIPSGRFSEPSKKFEFKTPVSHSSLLVSLIVGLSLVAVLISGAAVYCYVKVKKIWDNCPNPKVHIKPYQHEFLKPERSITSSVSIEPLFPYESKSWMKETLSDSHSGNLEHSSGVSTGSSCLSYANAEMPEFTACQPEGLRKAFPNIWPISPLPSASDPAAAGVPSPGHCGPTTADPQFNFENKFYAMVNPILPPQILVEGSEASKQMVCVSDYHGVEGDVAAGPAQATPALPALVFSSAAPSALATDMSYQLCGQDSGLSSGSSDSNTIPCCDPMVEAGGASTAKGANETTKIELAAKFNEDLRLGMSAPNGFPLVEDSYQPFQSLVSPPVAQMEKYLDQQPVKQIPDFISRALSGQCLPGTQRAFFTSLSTDRPPEVFDSGYEKA